MRVVLFLLLDVTAGIVAVILWPRWESEDKGDTPSMAKVAQQTDLANPDAAYL